jgi:hypothetical protein
VDLVVASFFYRKRGILSRAFSRAFRSRKLLNTGQSPRMGLINTDKNDIAYICARVFRVSAEGCPNSELSTCPHPPKSDTIQIILTLDPSVKFAALRDRSSTVHLW